MTETSSPDPQSWRSNHAGHWLRLALQHFDSRVMALMARHPAVPLGLSNLAERGQIGAAHIHITRHLDTAGSRLTDLAHRAGMTKQAMGTLVTQCEAWGLVRREGDSTDARAKRVVFTRTGMAWLDAYRDAVTQAETEMRQAVGPEVTTVVTLGLEAYCSQ
jgi:DNA-binding MarR family transcriptional regulator